MKINETKHKEISTQPYFYISKLCNQEYYADKYLFLINKNLLFYKSFNDYVDINFLIPPTNRIFVNTEDCCGYIFNIIKNEKITITLPSLSAFQSFYSENRICYNEDIKVYHELLNQYIKLVKIKDFLKDINNPYNMINRGGFKVIPLTFLIKKR